MEGYRKSHEIWSQDNRLFAMWPEAELNFITQSPEVARHGPHFPNPDAFHLTRRRGGRSHSRGCFIGSLCAQGLARCTDGGHPFRTIPGPLDTSRSYLESSEQKDFQVVWGGVGPAWPDLRKGTPVIADQSVCPQPGQRAAAGMQGPGKAAARCAVREQPREGPMRPAAAERKGKREPASWKEGAPTPDHVDAGSQRQHGPH
ncbi:hypothetical protein MJT46_015812 [Ovis ammon polii x Ovis aries]|nr:hypothetical protein MJT46_015812 [Ovis ammon polii x Ovis aries]